MSLQCTVVSFVPFEIFEEKPGLIPPSFRIPPSDGIKPQLFYVGTAMHFVYLDEARGNLQVKNPPDVIAKSIVEDYINSQLGVDDQSSPALFWFPEEINEKELMEKHKVEIVRRKLLQRQWFINLSKMADDDWRKYHQHNVISDFQRRIGEILQLDPREHEWMSPISMMSDLNMDCPYCSSSIPKKTVICPVCTKVLDYKRAKEIEESLIGATNG